MRWRRRTDHKPMYPRLHRRAGPDSCSLFSRTFQFAHSVPVYPYYDSQAASTSLASQTLPCQLKLTVCSWCTSVPVHTHACSCLALQICPCQLNCQPCRPCNLTRNQSTVLKLS